MTSHNQNMDTSFSYLISQERAKIDLLRQKIRECEMRISVFESMTDDDLDVALSKSLGSGASIGTSHATDIPAPLGSHTLQTPAHDAEHQTQPVHQFEVPKKRISSQMLKLLYFIGENGKGVDDLVGYAKQSAIDITRGGIRSTMNNYKNKFGLLVSPKDGFFRLSERGVAYLASLKSETPPVSAGGVSGTST